VVQKLLGLLAWDFGDLREGGLCFISRPAYLNPVHAPFIASPIRGSPQRSLDPAWHNMDDQSHLNTETSFCMWLDAVLLRRPLSIGQHLVPPHVETDQKARAEEGNPEPNEIGRESGEGLVFLG
jgi:hypothetical protein